MQRILRIFGPKNFLTQYSVHYDVIENLGFGSRWRHIGHKMGPKIFFWSKIQKLHPKFTLTQKSHPVWSNILKIYFLVQTCSYTEVKWFIFRRRSQYNWNHVIAFHRIAFLGQNKIGADGIFFLTFWQKSKGHLAQMFLLLEISTRIFLESSKKNYFGSN